MIDKCPVCGLKHELPGRCPYPHEYIVRMKLDRIIELLEQLVTKERDIENIG